MSSKIFVEIWIGDFENSVIDGKVEYLIYFEDELVGIFNFEISPKQEDLIRFARECLAKKGRVDLLAKTFIAPWHPDNCETHCWRWECHRTPINRFIALADGAYGNRCPNCQSSLREHPFFGWGMEYDKGDSAKWKKWKLLDFFGKSEVYRRYGFPLPTKR
jgi:hypothetical protein